MSSRKIQFAELDAISGASYRALLLSDLLKEMTEEYIGGPLENFDESQRERLLFLAIETRSATEIVRVMVSSCFKNTDGAGDAS